MVIGITTSSKRSELTLVYGTGNPTQGRVQRGAKGAGAPP
jgi:hypothetical protein